jgi:hypothetical protein
MLPEGHHATSGGLADGLLVVVGQGLWQQLEIYCVLSYTVDIQLLT